MSTDEQTDELIRRVTNLADEVGQDNNKICNYVEKLTALQNVREFVMPMSDAWASDI